MLPYISLESVQPLLTISSIVVQRIARIQKTFYPSGFYSNYIVQRRFFCWNKSNISTYFIWGLNMKWRFQCNFATCSYVELFTHAGLCLVSFTLRRQWTIYLHSNHSRKNCKEKIITWFGRECLELRTFFGLFWKIKKKDND